MRIKADPLTNKSEIKELLLQIMDHIDLVCKKNNIKYFIMFGSLLGAVRHKGFIPWDDDIDIVMMREDYDAFVQIMQHQDGDFAIITPETNANYYLPFAKVYHKKTILFEHVTHSLPIGLYVDVFPLDYCGNSLDESSKIIKNVLRVQKQLEIKNLQINNTRHWTKNVALVFLKALLIFKSKKRIINKIIEMAKERKSTPQKYVSCLCMIVYKEKAVFDLSCFDESILLQFENRLYNGPMDRFNLLSQIYGDYTKWPPINKRVSHHGYDVFYNNKTS